MNISEADSRPPPLRLLVREPLALLSRFHRAFGPLGPFGPEDGAPLMVLPGFLATDRSTLGLQKALANAGYRVTGWGLGMNRGVKARTIDDIVDQLERFGGGVPTILVGWSLGGIYAREVAKRRPDLVAKVVTMGSPFSAHPRANNVWRLYELIARHPVDAPPIETDLAEKPPVPTIALWSRKDGIVAPAAARGQDGERDRAIELECSHMAFAVSAKAWPHVVAAVRDG